MNNIISDKLYKATEVATLLNCSLRSVRNYQLKGLKHYKSATGRVTFLGEDILAWIKGE